MDTNTVVKYMFTKPLQLGWPALSYWPIFLGKVVDLLEVCTKDKDIAVPSRFNFRVPKFPEGGDYEELVSFHLKLMRLNERHGPSYKRGTNGPSYKVTLHWTFGSYVEAITIKCLPYRSRRKKVA